MKEVGIAELKAHLGKYLREVKRGASITITDRGTPVARLSAPSGSNGLSVRPAKGRLHDLKRLPPNDLDRDIVELLLEMRQNGR